MIIATSVVGAQNKVTFDNSMVLPKGWESGVTGTGTAKWEIAADETAPSRTHVLKQSGEATFCWAAKTDERIKDGVAEVRFKTISGKEDQAAGIVFRFTDANNYYVVRANALEDNVVLYKTVEGKRSSLPVKGRTLGYGFDTRIASGKWATLRIEFKDNLFTVFLDGKQLFQVEDATFKEPGAVGVWTKADSVTLFDDFTYGSK